MANKEDQNGEIEALESIYCEDFELLDENPLHCFTIQLRSQNINYTGDDPGSIKLKFTYVSDYPESAVPVMEVEDSTCLTDEHREQLLQHMTEQAEENLGMVSVFSIVSAVQERMDELLLAEKKRLEEEAERTEREKEEAEQNHFDGTRVTVESFLQWKLAFDAEMAELKKKSMADMKKPTGKQLFMNDSSLIDSDMKFLQEDVVDVDESLFQDLDDLELDEELDGLE